MSDALQVTEPPAARSVGHLTVTYFAPRSPRPDDTLDDKAYAAEHCKQTAPTSVLSCTLAELRSACERATVQGRKGDAGYIIAGACDSTRKEGGPAGFVLIDQDGGEPDWAALDRYEGFAWTTHGHSATRPAWRIVIPLVTPMAHGKLTCPFRGAHIRNRTQPAFLPTVSPQAVAEGQGVQWRALAGTARLDAAALGGAAATFEDADSSLLGALFEAAGWVEGEQAGGLIVRCPWVHEHSDHDVGGSVVFHADADGAGMGKYFCSRTKCAAANGGKGRTSNQALEAMRGIPAVAAELGHWQMSLDGWVRGGVQVLREDSSDPLQMVPSVDASGLRLAPTGWPWVLRKGQWCWLHEIEREAYGQPIEKADLRLQIKRTHARAITLIEQTEKGAREITPAEFENVYEHRVRELKATYLARANTWDAPTATLTMAALRWAPLQAREHADVGEWLRALGGARYPALAQWLASCVALKRPAPALYLHGELKVGKSLLARGIARLWQTEPAPFAEALDSFNEATATCPLMYADEGFPDKMSFNVFREMVTSPARRVNEKYKPKYAIEGCVRIILSTNNSQALRYQRTGVLTSQDMHAVADRLLVIHAGAEARDVLKRLNAASFVDENKLAEHVWWLADTVALEPSHERMCAKSGDAGEVLDALQAARYPLHLRAIATSKAGDGVFVDSEAVWVNAQMLHKAAKAAAFVAHETEPREHDTRDFVAAFVDGKHRKFRLPGTSEESAPLWWHPLSLTRLKALLERAEV